jgi:hypothetical protein
MGTSHSTRKRTSILRGYKGFEGGINDTNKGFSCQVQGAKSKAEIKKAKAELQRQRDAGEIPKETFEEKFNKLMMYVCRKVWVCLCVRVRCASGHAHLSIIAAPAELACASPSHMPSAPCARKT